MKEKRKDKIKKFAEKFGVKVLKKENTDIEELEKGMAEAIFYVEKEVNQHIDAKYPLMKLFSQMEHLHRHFEMERREMDRAKRK